MITFFKKYGYLIFVVVTLGLLVGGYFMTNELSSGPLVTVTGRQQQLVRHEKNENKLTTFERYLEKKLSIHFTAKQLQQAATWVVSLSLAVLLLEPLLVWLIYRRKPAPTPAEFRQLKSKVNHDPYRIDHDTDRNFKPWL
ncbi:hypothetical protein [Lapidilactobacillus luobeiensis]|uniref:hypothetical protein n=1 Tax=Lapidilactobacillus luobeiensis TaxID=2950371 RepID=UPI0021C43F87|nr:hypothetical protein [Lapidilactobacillus luobeiensis]